MNKSIYLDNAATTRVCEEAADKAIFLMRELYANPSSVHSFGNSAAKELESARRIIVSALGFGEREGELIFTSSGTEAANLALFGVAHAYKRRGNRIIITDSEHPCVYNCAARLAEEGFDVQYIPTRGGMLDLEAAKSMINDKTVLISAMSVNNETGAIYDIPALDRLRKELAPSCILHTDAVQAFLKSASPLSESGADLISVSAHKVHAPKGCGAIYVKKGVRLSPLIFGGGQEKDLRSGTEALPMICAFGEAVKSGLLKLSSDVGAVKELKEYAVARLNEDIPDVRVNSPKVASPYVLSVIIPDIKSEIMLRFLSDRGIFVSAGSACSSKHRENRVLTAFGLSNTEADFTLRISFSQDNTKDEIDYLVKCIAEGKSTLMPVKFISGKAARNK